MFKILLINPPRKNMARLETSLIVDLGEISSFPPIGLMYLAQALRQKNKAFKVKILDAVAEKLSYWQMIRKILKFSPDIVGLTTSTFNFYDTWKSANKIKKAMSKIPIAIGGSHMYIFPTETMTHRCFDYGVVGDGEEVFANLCQMLYEKRKVRPLTGLYFRQGKKICGQGVAGLKNLDVIKVPAVDLMNHFAYYSTLGKEKAVGTICTSRGCPFRCTFCQVPHRHYRMRSIENVMKEIEAYLEKNITDFFFFDDLFNLTKERVIHFCEEILHRNLKISWMFRGRIDQIDEKMLKLCHKAGCHTISVGIEDATNKGLRAIKKNITIEQAYKAVNLIRKNGIYCATNWIIGFPHHRTLKDLQHLLDTVIKIDPNYAEFSILICLPGSELYEQAVCEGGIDPQTWRNYVLNPYKNFSPPLWEKNLTKSELFAFYGYAFRRFYLRPKVFFREMLQIRSLPELITKLNAIKTIFWRRH